MAIPHVFTIRLGQIFLSFCTLVTVSFAKEIPLLPPQSMPLDDDSPLLGKQPEKEIELQGIRVSDELGHLTDVDINGTVELSSRKEDSETTVTGPGSALVNLLTNVRMLPSEMRSVLIVMALCWVGLLTIYESAYIWKFLNAIRNANVICTGWQP
jgi:solute carrier family 45 protein 1/2/4